MKHAYLIMAHNDTYMLKTLIELLDYPGNDIYVHFDLKSKLNLDFDSIKLSHSKLFLADRMDVRWADISQVDCELKLFKMALGTGYDYYHLLSGSDLPLKSQKEIHYFFENNKGKEFVHFCKLSEEYLFYKFISHYHFFQKQIACSNFIVSKLINKVSLYIQELLKIDRLKNDSIVIKKGANWISVTHDFLTYLVSQEAYIRRRFKWTKSPDEFFVQTVISNSKYRDKLFMLKNNDDYHACMRMIDWKRGAPYIYRNFDYDELMASDYLFARKFNSTVDKEIIDRISNAVKNKNIID